MKQTAKILLVDDEPGMLRYIKTLLEVDDYNVETATTGEEAVLRVEKGLQPDLVLLDAPCSGLGILGRQPEARWRKNSDDPVRMAEVQRKLIDAAAGGVKPGGALVYAVCSTDRREGEDIVEAFLAGGRLAEARTLVRQSEAVSAWHWWPISAWPGRPPASSPTSADSACTRDSGSP